MWTAGMLYHRYIVRFSSPSVVFQVVDEKLFFVKVHMPFDLLCTYAEVMHIKLPIQPNDLASKSNFMTRLLYPEQEVLLKKTKFFTAPFRKDQLQYFYMKDREQFFTPAMRSRMVRVRSQFEVICSCVYVMMCCWFAGVLHSQSSSVWCQWKCQEVWHL